VRSQFHLVVTQNSKLVSYFIDPVTTISETRAHSHRSIAYQQPMARLTCNRQQLNSSSFTVRCWSYLGCYRRNHHVWCNAWHKSVQFRKSGLFQLGGIWHQVWKCLVRIPAVSHITWAILHSLPQALQAN